LAGRTSNEVASPSLKIAVRWLTEPSFQTVGFKSRMDIPKMRDKILSEGPNWYIDLGGVAGRVRIANPGCPSPANFEYCNAGEPTQWMRVQPLVSFMIHRFVENAENPTGVFFTPHNFSSTGRALEDLHLTGWNSPNYKGLVKVNNPEYMDVGFFTGSSRIEIVVEDQSKIEYCNFTAQCPFCRETIIKGAIKCKHCGEFLDKTRSTSTSPQGSDSARAVARGLKEKESADIALNFFIGYVLVISGFLGYTFKSWWVFGIICVIGLVLCGAWYYRE
jgi:hypothetical protein